MSANPPVTVSDHDAQAIIQVRGLVNQFGSQVVHQDLNLTVRRGEILGVVGGSGTGKSVLMRCILGLHHPNAGLIEMLGIKLPTHDQQQLRFMTRRTGVLFQDGALFSSLTVQENIQVPLKEHCPELSPFWLERLAQLKVQLAGLPMNALAKLPAELSGGMRKRAGLARALALDPPVLFLDEPTAGLDPISAAAFDQLIQTLRDALGLTIFLITHDLDTLYAICDRVAVLADRQVIATAEIQSLESLSHPWVQRYFHGPRARAARLHRSAPDSHLPHGN